MAEKVGFEPTNNAFKGHRLNQACQLLSKWSEWEDSNLRPPAPKAGALARLRYTPINGAGGQTRTDDIWFTKPGL